jgi:DNA-binding transcriptional MerR regulator
MSIGEVLARLRAEFPDITLSKLRFLEAEGLVEPQRTPAGYRKYSAADLARLRYVLAAQRDQYLPLRVIKENLDALDSGRPLPGPAAVPAPSADGGAAEEEQRSMSDAELCREAGLAPELLAESLQHGLLTPGPDGRHPAGALAVARAAAGLARHGIEPRHLRVHRADAEREAALVEQVVAPQLMARSEEARARATEQLRELAALSAHLHTALLSMRLAVRLDDLLRP